MRGYEHDTVVVRALHRWYERYAKSARGLRGPCIICEHWPCVGCVEKLGKGLGQPEGRSQLLGYSLCGQLIFDVSRLESYVYAKWHHLKVVPSRHSSCPEQLE